MAMKLDEAYVEMRIRDAEARAAMQRLRETIRTGSRQSAEDGGRAAEALMGHYKNAGQSIEHGLLHSLGAVGRMLGHGGLLGAGAMLGAEGLMEVLPKMFGGGKEAAEARAFSKELASLNVELFEMEARMDDIKRSGTGTLSAKQAEKAYELYKKQYEQATSEKAEGVEFREKIRSEAEQKIKDHPERYAGELGQIADTTGAPRIAGRDRASQDIERGIDLTMPYQGTGSGAAGNSTSTMGVLRDTFLGMFSGNAAETAKRNQLAEKMVGEEISKRQDLMTQAGRDMLDARQGTGPAHLSEISAFAEQLTAAASGMGEKDEQVELLKQIRDRLPEYKPAEPTPPSKNPVATEPH